MPDPLKILVADDDENIRNLLASVLTPAGYAVTAVTDGQAAVDAHKTLRPTLIILDVQMPGKDGLAACEEIRRTDPEVLILFLTGQKAQVNTAMGLDAGADSYVTKPFGPRELLARVKALLRRVGL